MADIVAAANTASSLSQPKKYCTWPEGLKLLLKCLCHCWDKDGNHQSYRSVQDVVVEIKKIVPEVSEKTIRNKCTLEFKKLPDGSAQTLTKRPTLTVSSCSMS